MENFLLNLCLLVILSSMLVPVAFLYEFTTGQLSQFLGRAGRLQSEFKFAGKTYQEPGRIDLYQFCINAEVPPKVASGYLDRQLEAFGAIRDVDVDGQVTYYFGPAKQKFILKHRSD